MCYMHSLLHFMCANFYIHINARKTIPTKYNQEKAVQVNNTRKE